MKKVMIGFSVFMAFASAFAWNGYNYNDYQVNSYSNVDSFASVPDYRVCAVAITRELRMGSQNSEVTTLQDYLHDQGYLIVAPNGYFGSATRKAVMLFQADHNISTTGSVGPVTRQEINDEICNVNDTVSYSNSYNLPVVAHTTQIPTTYVSSADPFITPTITTNYSVPQNNFVVTNTSYTGSYPVPVNTNNLISSVPALITPAITPVASQIQDTRIVNNPATGYIIGITQKPSSITIASPLPNTFFAEGDTINIAWSSSNLSGAQYQVLLENTVTTQSRPVTTTSGNTASIFLSKELLDAVCAGSCDANQQRSFRIVVSTPVTDIAGVTTNFRAVVTPVNIKRATEFLGGVSISATKSPINSGEGFKLFTSIPTGTIMEAGNSNLYSFRLRAVCPVAVTVSIAGTPCGVDIPVPYDAPFFNQQIPVIATSTSWYKQDVTFELLILNAFGQVMSTSRTTVTVNPAPFNW
jgi:peptidoglycan hydrolase-like protein with peptidoglycan-binding domain